MNWLRKTIQQSPLSARVAPFFVFVGLMVAQPGGGEAGAYWLYLARTIAGAWTLWMARPVITEFRWAFSWEAVAVGIVVCAMWIGIDGCYYHIGAKESAQSASQFWNPMRQFGEGSILAWFFIVVRIAGSSLVVPPIEELFYRSFLYRYIVNQDFMKVALSQFGWAPFLVTSLIFGFEHSQWLAGILCGFAYQWLVIRKGRLGDAITAHAITNFLLGVWVVWRCDWKFW